MLKAIQIKTNSQLDYKQRQKKNKLYNYTD